MRIFDIHTHVYPDAVAQKATDSVKEFYGIPGAGLDGKVSTLLQQGQEVGISGYLILPVAIRPDRVHGINDYILQQTQLHPEFVGFGSVHAAMDGIGEEARRIMEITRRKQFLPVRVTASMHDLVDRASNQNFVPVVDDYGAFIGLITRKAIIQYCQDKLFPQD